MASNANLMKADLALSNLVSTGGVLVDEQANSFIRKLIKEPTLLRGVRTVEMLSPTRQINKILFDARILRAGVQGVALAEDAGDTGVGRAKPVTEQILMDTFEVIAEVRLPYDVLEDNIERIGSLGTDGDGGSGSAMAGGLRDTIVTLIAERAALDLEELAVNGDTASGDAYLALNEGYLETVKNNGNIVDFGGAVIDKDLFKAGMQTLPDQYHRGLSTMRHYVSVDNDVEYRDRLADRGTGLGDSFVQGTQAPTPYGVPVERVQVMGDTVGLFTNPLNLIFGIQRSVMMEFDKSITQRVYIIVLTARVDFQVEESDAAVYYQNIAAPL